jgi:GrpB-like predicted nucleotidyltransferase (UPF0157 family)
MFRLRRMRDAVQLRYAAFMKENESVADQRAAAGLCADCTHARGIESARGSSFILCELSFTDVRFIKYPRLPVLACDGYRGKMSKSTNPVVVVEYDPRWPATFEALRSRVAGVLGDLAAAIEHIGSTAVPGMAAKPIIDMDVLLKSGSDLPQVIQRLDALGYVHQGDLGIAGREAFAAPPDAPAHHLYVCPPESQEYRRHLTLRDYLRAHDADAAAYSGLKHSLAARFRDDRAAYCEGKQEFIERLLQQAMASRRETGSG